MNNALPKPMPMGQLALYFLLLFMFSSFVDLRFSAGGKGFFTLSNFEVCGYIMLAALAVSATMQTFAPKTVGLLSDRVHRWLLLYFSWGVVASLLVRGETGMYMLIDLKKLLPSMVGYFSIILLITSHRRAKLLLTAWVSAGMINVLLALSQFFLGGPHPVKLGQNALEKLDMGGEVAGRLVTGFFNHPNAFSQIIIPYFVVFTVSWFLSARRCSVTALRSMALSGIFGFVLLLTNAKGALLWSLIAIAVGMAMSRWGRLRSGFFFAASWLFSVLAINSLALLLLLNIVEYDSLRTLFSRLQFVVASYNIFSDHPANFIVGGGMRFWPEYCAIWANWDYPNAHNVFLNQLLWYGGVGLGLLVAFILAHIKRGLQSGTVASDPIFSSLPYVAAVLALTGSYFFEPSFGDPIQKFQLFFVLAMCFVLPKIQIETPGCR
jgi:hypothetical protein